MPIDQQSIQYFVGILLKIVIVFVIGLLSPVAMNWVERRTLAFIQMRLGPNRTGPFGLLQSLADGIKFAFKEDIVPLAANKWLYIFAPVVAVVPAFMATIVYPLGPKNVEIPFAASINSTVYSLTGIQLNLSTMDLHVTSFNVGLLYVLAITSLGVYAIVMAGWASNSKFSLLGGLRSSAQMVSYELSLSLALVGVLIQAGTADLVKIVEMQQGFYFGFIPKWFVFVFQPLGFLIYLISAIAETNRTPFDLPEAETELVGGFHTEYSSSLKFAMLFMAEYVNMLTVSVLATALFLGGWSGPFVSEFPLLAPVYFLLKVFFFMFLYIWLRGTLPRLRYDQLMNFGWKFLLPAALLNIFISATIALFAY
jgi:NADH-quinone oxidoreductase subunit H